MAEKKPRKTAKRDSTTKGVSVRDSSPIKIPPSVISRLEEVRIDEDGSEPRDLEDVEISTSPWVSGTRSTVYFGPIHSELFLDRDLPHDRAAACAVWSKAVRELLDALRERARALGANAIVGLAVSLDPFARSSAGKSGLRLRAVGTAVRTDPLA